MKKIEILDFLDDTADATADDIANRFGVPRSWIYSQLTVFNRQGLITKRKGVDGVLHFGLTNWGREKLGWLESKEDKEDLEENKFSGGSNMSKQIVNNDEGSTWVCPRCDAEYTLTFPVDEDDLYCESCDELLQPCEDEEAA